MFLPLCISPGPARSVLSRVRHRRRRWQALARRQCQDNEESRRSRSKFGLYENFLSSLIYINPIGKIIARREPNVKGGGRPARRRPSGLPLPLLRQRNVRSQPPVGVRTRLALEAGERREDLVRPEAVAWMDAHRAPSTTKICDVIR